MTNALPGRILCWYAGTAGNAGTAGAGDRNAVGAAAICLTNCGNTGAAPGNGAAAN